MRPQTVGGSVPLGRADERANDPATGRTAADLRWLAADTLTT
jgi:hypothetical protein